MNIKKIWVVVIGGILFGCSVMNNNKTISEYQNEEVVDT